MSKRKSTTRRKSNGRTKARSRESGERGSHPRAVWKGAVSFGLVYIPVHLHTAARDSALDLDLLDSKDFAPVGYQRYNKRTGKTVDWNRIVTQLVSALVFGAAGVLLFLVSFRLLRSVLPFSIAKEIAEDQNIALAIVLGAAMIAIGTIVSVAIAWRPCGCVSSS